MGALKKGSIKSMLAAGLLLQWPGAAFPQSFDGQYQAILDCAKLPFTDVPLSNEPVDLKISNGKVSYARTLYGANRSAVVGKETGTGTVAADGTIALTGGWKGRRDTVKASYGGKLSGGETRLSGKHIVIYQGRSYDRSCTLTLKK